MSADGADIGQDLGSIEKVNQAMPSASFGVDTYAQSDVDMRDAAYFDFLAPLPYGGL